MTRGMDYATLDALRQIDTGRESDPQKRLTELQVRRDAVDAEIRRILAGEIALLDATALWAGSKGACQSACYTSSCSNYRK